MALFPNIGESIHKHSSHSKCWNMLEVGRVSSFNLLVFMMFFVCYYCIIDWNTTKGSKHPVPTSVDLVANGCRIPQRQSHEGYGLLGVTKMCDKHHISSYMAYMMTYMRQLFWIPIFMRTLLLSTWYTCMMEGKNVTCRRIIIFFWRGYRLQVATVKMEGARAPIKYTLVY